VKQPSQYAARLSWKARNLKAKNRKAQNRLAERAPGVTTLFVTRLRVTLPLALVAAAACDTAPTEDEPVSTCATPEGVSGEPATIDEARDLINALLEKNNPLSLPCFLESLDRPLKVDATRSIFSAQPAAGRRSPRVFIFSDTLTLSVVPDGAGSHFLEFGELESDNRSIKGELEFPITQRVGREAPFESLEFGVVTTCGLCHAAEEARFNIDNAVVSGALKPIERDDVPLFELYEEQQACDPEDEPYRCQMFDALLNFGDVIDTDFPEEMPTFFDN